jgi:hypothetical protein
MRGRLAIFLTIVVMLVVLVGLNAASYVRVEAEGDSEARPDRSTLNAGATGTRALYEYLEETGHAVQRWGLPPSALVAEDGEEKPSTFVVVGQTRRRFEGGEARDLLRWVARGGRLVVVDRSSQLLPASGRWRVTSEVYDEPGFGVRPEDADSMTKGVPVIVPAQPTALTREVAQVTRSRFAARLHVYSVEPEVVQVVGPGGGGGGGYAGPRRAAPPPTPEPTEEAEEEDDLFGIEDEGPPVNVSELPEAAAVEDVERAPVQHLADGREGTGSLLVDYAYGRGRVVVLSDPYIVSNAGLNRSDNLLLAANVVAGGGRAGRIAFDEFHQGFGSARNRFLAYFAGTPILWLFAQAAFIAAAVVWTRGRRFARPLPAPHVDRRSKLEFVASMAELQQRARAYDLAVENIYGRTRRALARYAGVAADASPDVLAARVAARSGRDPRQLEALLRECEDAMAGAPLDARKALSLVAALRELERELGIRMRSREIRQAERA